LKVKVLFDSCVIVAGSVFMSGKDDLGIELKHHFYEEAMRLFSLIKKNLSKRIGVVTATIENEALRVLNEAVRGEIRTKYRELDRKTLFEYSSIALNACDSRMRKLLSLLQREPVESDKVAVWFTQVAKMYKELKDMAQERKNLKETASMKAQAVPKKVRKYENWYRIYLRDERRRHAQLLNLLKKDVEAEDQIILAEACYLFNLYKQIEGKDVSFFIASTDHHFSPVRRKGWAFESRQVTDEIEKRFGIICDWPDRIYERVSKLV